MSVSLFGQAFVEKIVEKRKKIKKNRKIIKICEKNYCNIDNNMVKYTYQIKKGDNPMKKVELIEKIAAETGMTKKDVNAVCDALVATIADVMAADDSIQLAGFGTFSSKSRAARTGRNPQTGATIEIPASRQASFSASKALKDKLNG